MSFSPATDWLAASSWDGKVKVWEIQPNGTTVPKTEINLEAPALTCAWAMVWISSVEFLTFDYCRMVLKCSLVVELDKVD
jgi:WD40 repeat protein